MKPCDAIAESGRVAGASPTPFLTACHFHEIHRSGVIDADGPSILSAVEALDVRDDAVIRTLMAIREWPGKAWETVSGRARAAAPPFGLASFTLLRRDARELSFGLVGRFWRPDMGLATIADADAFRCHRDAGDAKLVLRFHVDDAPQGGAVLMTETFVYCPNRRVRMLFTPYWLAIRLGSGWIRRRTLRTIEQAFGGAR